MIYVKKYIFVLVIMLLITFSMLPSYASHFIGEIGDTSSAGSYNIELKQMADDVNDTVATTAGKIYKTIRIFAIMIAVIATAVVGLSYITAGSAAKKADLKARLGFIVVGLVLALSATYIVQIIADFWDKAL